MSKTLSLIPSARASDFKYFLMFAGKGRETLRNSSSAFARKDWSYDDAGSSKKALLNFGPHINNAGKRNNITRRENIS